MTDLNEAKAREIVRGVEKNGWPKDDEDFIIHRNFYQRAVGYLACLEGPEIQKLHNDYTGVIREKDKIIERQDVEIAELSSLVNDGNAEVLKMGAKIAELKKQKGCDHLDGPYRKLLQELAAEREKSRALVETLKSIAANTCCDKCQEATLVAKSALSAFHERSESSSEEKSKGEGR